RAQPFKLLLVLDAEAMLFVDDHESEILELDVVLQELVGADHDVDAAARDALQHFLGSLRAAKARQLLDAYGPIRKPVGERAVVLLRQQGRRYEHRYLVTAVHSDESRAQCHFSLAESDVAADDPVHRL